MSAEHIIEESVLPQELVRIVSGQVQYEEEGTRVVPIQDSPNEAIRIASVQFIREHLLNNRNQQILAQVKCLFHQIKSSVVNSIPLSLL